MNSYPVMMMTAMNAVIFDWNHRKPRPLSIQRPSCSSPKRVRLSKVKKTTVVFKRAMTEKRERWQGKEWYGRTKSRWQQPAGEDGGQGSHDTWNISQPQVERNPCGDGRSGNHCERKDEFVEQKLKGECEKRNGTVQDG